MAASKAETWLPNFPPRYSPAASSRLATTSRRFNTKICKGTTKPLAFDRFKPISWCDFKIPSTDEQIRADTYEGVPMYPIPSSHDGFTIVRRYLYSALTGTGWGISGKYPAAVRATVEGWYGNGRFFRMQCEEQDGLKDLCPPVGRDSEGFEVSFDARLRDLIRNCVRYESHVLLQQDMGIGDAGSAARSYEDDLEIQYVGRDHKDEEGVGGKGKMHDLVEKAEAVAKQPHGRSEKEPDTELPEGPVALDADDCSVYTETAKEDTAPRPGSPRRDSGFSADVAKQEADGKQDLAAPYTSLIAHKIELAPPLEPIRRPHLWEPRAKPSYHEQSFHHQQRPNEQTRTSPVRSRRNPTLPEPARKPCHDARPYRQPKEDMPSLQRKDSISSIASMESGLSKVSTKRAEFPVPTARGSGAASSSTLSQNPPAGYKHKRRGVTQAGNLKSVSPLETRLEAAQETSASRQQEAIASRKAEAKREAALEARKERQGRALDAILADGPLEREMVTGMAAAKKERQQRAMDAMFADRPPRDGRPVVKKDSGMREGREGREVGEVGDGGMMNTAVSVAKRAAALGSNVEDVKKLNHHERFKGKTSGALFSRVLGRKK